MNLEEVQLIATDMDNTLLTSNHELPPKFDEMLQNLLQLKVEFVIATGRPFYTLEKMFANYLNEISFVSDNGGVITYKGQVLFQSLIARKDYSTMVSFVTQNTSGVCILSGAKAAYISEKDRQYKEHLHNFYSNIEVVENLQQLDIEVAKFSTFFPNEDSKAYFNELFKPRFSEQFSVSTSDTCWIDIMNKNVNKGNAVKSLGEELGISNDNMMAFGDAFNDKEMLQKVAYSFVVANADPELAAYAKYKTLSNDQYGVKKVIEQVILAKEWAAKVSK